MRRPPTSLRVLAMTVVAAGAVTGLRPGPAARSPCPDCLDLGRRVRPDRPGVDRRLLVVVDPGPGRRAGLHPRRQLPDAPLTIFGPGEESGTFDSFNELAIVDIAEERGVPEEEALARPDYISSPNDNVIIDGVAGIGRLVRLGRSRLRQATSDTRPDLRRRRRGRSLRRPRPTRPSPTASYPLARDLYMYVNLEHAAEDPAVAAYVDGFLSDEGRSAVGEAGYVALEDDAWAATLEAWAAAGGQPGDPAEDVDGRRARLGVLDGRADRLARGRGASAATTPGPG